MEDFEDFMVYCKTLNSYEMTKLIDMLKEVLDEAKIDFIRDQYQGVKSDKKSDENSDNEEDEEMNNDKKSKGKDKKVKKDEDEEDERPVKGKKKNTKKSKDEDEDEEKPDKKAKGKKGKISKNKEDDVDSDEEDKEEVKKEKRKNNGGIRIIALDPYRTLLIYVKLSSEEFQEFYVKPKTMYSIGLDLVQLHKFMKTVDKDSVMTMKIDKEDQQFIKFELENTVKNNITTYQQKVMDIDDDPTKLPSDTSFEMSVAMDTSDFRKICQEMSQFADYVEITCTPKEIRFRCEGDSAAFEKVFKSSDNTGVRIMCPEKAKEKNGEKGKKDKLVMVQAIYNLKHLVTFGKCVNLCTEMQLFLKNDYPLFINYPIGNIGKMLVGLSPVDEKTIKRDADYDDGNDKYYGNNKKPTVKDN